MEEGTFELVLEGSRGVFPRGFPKGAKEDVPIRRGLNLAE